jgi:glutamyl-tRNA synthetase
MLRFAPSPVADMTLSDLRVAILNYIVAKQRDDRFLVRIEDIDKSQNIEGKDTEIMMILEKFALKHDSVYHQTQHLNIHQSLALRLIKEGKAFKDELSSSESVVKIEEPKESIIFNDILNGEIKTKIDEVGSFTILKSNGTPTAIFATACDDILSGVNFIIRDKRFLEDTPKQIHIKNLLDYKDEIKYAHLPPILDDVTIKYLFELGFIPDAIANYILLEHSVNLPKEIFFSTRGYRVV